jgi:hypothetical protein
MGVSLYLNQGIDARFRDEQVLAVHLEHHEPFLVQSDQTPALGLRLSPSVGVLHQVRSIQHDHPFHQPRSWGDHSADRRRRTMDVHGHFHGFGCQWCRILIESAHTELVNAAEAFEDTFRKANVVTKETDKPRPWLEIPL